MRATKDSINWDKIDVVLLDMDGTLLDRHYEDFFWDNIVPKGYAKKHSMTVQEAKSQLYELYKKEDGKMNWSDINFWEKELNMKLWDMRYQIRHLVRLHPHTIRFLRFLKQHRKKIYIVTASQEKDIKFKMKHSKIGKYFDGIYSQFNIGKTKYEKAFWKRLHNAIKYNRNTTLFADDREGIVKAAKSSGIKWVLLKSKSSSKKHPRIYNGLLYVHHFDDVIPKRKGVA